MHGLIAAALLAFVLLAARPTRAGEGQGSAAAVAAADPLLSAVDVEWNAPDGCPESVVVREQIRSLLAQASAMVPAARGLVFRANVQRAGEHWTMHTESGARSAPQRKQIDADSCAALSDAFALIVAFAIDPASNPREERQPFAPPPAIATATIAAEASALQPLASAEAHPFTFSVGAVAATGVGILPWPAAGFGARIAAGERWHWELAALAWPEKQALLAGATTAAEVGVRVGLLSLEPSACVPLAWHRWAACAGVQLGTMRGVGVVASPSPRQSWWLAVSAGVAAEIAVARHFGLRVRLDAGVPVFRPTFALDQVGPPDPVQVFRPAPLFAIFSVEPELLFSATDPGRPGH